MAVNLLATISSNFKPFLAGVSSVSAATGKLFDRMSDEGAKSFQKKFFNKFNLFAAVAGIGAGVVSALKGAKEIQEAAKGFGLTAEEFQAAEIAIKRLGGAADVTKQQFIDMVSEVRSGGEIVSNQVNQSLVEASDKFDKYYNYITSKLKLIAVSAIESVSSSNIAAGMAGVSASYGNPASAPNAPSPLNPKPHAPLTDRFDTYLSSKQNKDKEAKDKLDRQRFNRIGIEQDQLSRVGLFVTGKSPTYQIANRQLKELRAIKKHMEKNNNLLGKVL